jgi:hypothetical protein
MGILVRVGAGIFKGKKPIELKRLKDANGWLISEKVYK